MRIIDKINEVISDAELYESEYMLMNEADNKGKNTKIRERRIKLQHLKLENIVHLQHLDYILFVMRITCKAVNNIPITKNEVSKRVTNIGELSSKKLDLKHGNVLSYLSKENSLPIERE